MIPIKEAKVIAENTGMKQVIVFGWDGSDTHVATYGVTENDCSVAATGANIIKRRWAWPDELMAEPSRVQALYNKIHALEAEIKELKSL